MDHERVLTALDKEIEAAQRTLDRLTTARSSYAAAHGLTGRRAPVTSPDGGEGASTSIATLALRVMKDGAWWHVDDVTAAIERERPGTRKGTVNTMLARGVQDGHLERHATRKGTYRVKPEVVAGWPGSAGTSDARGSEHHMD